MSETILSARRRQRELLAALGPGERVISGRVYYSAAWLSVRVAPLTGAVKAALDPPGGAGHDRADRSGLVG